MNEDKEESEKKIDLPSERDSVSMPPYLELYLLKETTEIK